MQTITARGRTLKTPRQKTTQLERIGRPQRAAAIQMPTSTAAILKDMTYPGPKWSDVNRRRYGVNADLAAIEGAILNANNGLMADITSLEDETKDLDPRMSTSLSKRFGRVMTAPWRCDPCIPPGGDKSFAKELAETTQYVLEQLPMVREKLRDMQWANYYGRMAFGIHWMQVAAQAPGSRRPLRFIPYDLSRIAPRKLSFGPTYELRYIDPWMYPGYFTNTSGAALDDEPGKFLSWCPSLFCDDPEREGLGPRCLYWSLFKRQSWKMRLKLTELFGIPWRIVKAQKDAMVGVDQMQSAYEAAQGLGEDCVAVLGQGMDMDVTMPDGNTGALFSMTSKEVDEQLEALILWQTATTTPQAAGLASNTTGVLRSELVAVIASDYYGASERIRDQLIRPFILLNYGMEAAQLYTPHVVIDVSVRDRAQELATKKLVMDMGVPVPVREIREAGGVAEPVIDEGGVPEPTVSNDMLQPFAAQDVAPIAPADEKDPTLGLGAASLDNLPFNKSDVTKILKVKQALAMMGLPPLGDFRDDMTMDELSAYQDARGAQGESAKAPPAVAPVAPIGALPSPAPGANASPTPAPATMTKDEQTDETIAAFALKMTELQVERCQHGGVNRCRICGIERTRDVSLAADGSPVFKIAWRPIGQKVAPGAPAPGDVAAPAASSPSPGDPLTAPTTLEDDGPPGGWGEPE